MDACIQVNKEKKVIIPYKKLPIYQLFCEQLGFQTQWDHQERVLQLTSRLEGKKIYLVIESNDVFTTILENIKSSLKQFGIDLVVLSSNSSSPRDGEIVIHLKCNYNNSTPLPRFSILHSSGFKGKSWAMAFQLECKRNNFPIKIRSGKKSSVPSLELSCKLPECTETDKQLQENITLFFISALFRGLTKDNLSTLIPFLSLETMQLLFQIQQNTISSEATLETTEKKQSPSLNTENSDKNNHLVPAKQDPSTPPFRLEVYFDYQVFVPTSEDDTYLILGNMYLKNTGIMTLANPHICFQVTPPGKIQLKGQIVPPSLVDTVGVQGFNGNSAVGWRYLEDNWFQKAKDQGEYWICPIQPMLIQPEETQIFPNFQFSIPRSEIEGTITIQGMVYFKELNFQFSSNNRIVLAFS
jgi:hypothetical protein